MLSIQMYFSNRKLEVVYIEEILHIYITIDFTYLNFTYLYLYYIFGFDYNQKLYQYHQCIIIDSNNIILSYI